MGVDAFYVINLILSTFICNFNRGEMAWQDWKVYKESQVMLVDQVYLVVMVKMVSRELMVKMVTQVLLDRR